MSLMSDLIGYILADAPIVAIVDDRVQPGRRPQSDPLPALTLVQVSGNPEYADDGDAGLQSVRIQIDCWADSYGAGDALADLVVAALSAVRDVTQGGTTFRYIMLDNRQDLSESGANASEYLFRTSVDFTIWAVF